MTKPALARQGKQAGRMYVHPLTGEKGVSITTVIKHRNSGDGLMGWAVKACADAVGEWLYNLANLAKRDEKIGLHELLKYVFKKDIEPLKKEWKSARYRLKAPGSPWSPAKTGDLAHDAVENWIVSGGTFSLSRDEEMEQLLEEAGMTEAEALEVIRPWLDNFLAWDAKWNPEYLLTEATVWSRKHKYVGTADICARIRGKVVWLDLKTGKRVYPEYAMQLKAIQNADVIVQPDGTEQDMPVADKCCILHVTPKQWVMHDVPDEPGIYRSFLGLLQALQAELDTSQNWLGAQWKGSAK